MWRGEDCRRRRPARNGGSGNPEGPGGPWRLRVGRAGPRRPPGPGCAPPSPSRSGPGPAEEPPAGAPRFLAAHTRTTHRTPAGQSSRAAGAPRSAPPAPAGPPPPAPAPARSASGGAEGTRTHLSLSMSAAEACGKPKRGSAGGRRALRARPVRPGTAGTGGRGGRGGGGAPAPRSLGGKPGPCDPSPYQLRSRGLLGRAGRLPSNR